MQTAPPAHVWRIKKVWLHDAEPLLNEGWEPFAGYQDKVFLRMLVRK